MQDISSPPQDNAERIINENFNSVLPASLYGRRAPAATGLTWAYWGGRFNGNTVADGIVALTASSTNYVVAARSTGAVTAATNTTNWNNSTDYIQLYSIVAGASTVTSYVDFRQAYGGAGGGGGAADFIDLGDVPSSYSGEDGKYLRVNSTEDGLEFATPAGAGDVVGPGASTDNALVRWDGSGGDDVQDSGVLVTDNNEISGYRAHLNQQTGTTYTLQASDAGKIVELTNGAAIALTVPNSFPVGFNCTIVQGGAGQVTVASTGSGTVVNRQSLFKTAGANALAVLYVRSNSGTNAVWVLGGDVAA